LAGALEDRSDRCAQLAEPLRTQLLPTIRIADAATRARRQLLRGPAFLVRQPTQLKNRIHGHLSAENQVNGPLYGKAGRVWLTVALSPALRAQADVQLRLVDALTLEIQMLDHRRQYDLQVIPPAA
jgi:transposase